MKSIDKVKTRSMMAFVLMAMLIPIAVSAQTFEIVDLGKLGGASAGANAIAEDGASVGWADSTEEQRTPFLKSCAECSILNMGFLPYGTDGATTAISHSGAYLVGYSGINFRLSGPTPSLGTEVTQAFFWHEGVMQELGALYNPALVGRRHGHSEAHGVNDQGQVVGFSVIQRAGAYHAFLWEDGDMRDITPDPFSADITRAFDINNKSQIVGDAAKATESPATWPLRSAFLWEGGTTQTLASLDGHTASSARAINENSQVAGWSGMSGTDYADLIWSHAVFWDNGTIRNLGTLPGDESSQALAINDLGAITGWSGSVDRGVSTAFLWRCEQMHDLNTLVHTEGPWHLSEARGINNAGEIVGIGLKAGELRAYQLRPVSDAPAECSGAFTRPLPGQGRGVLENPEQGTGPEGNIALGRGPVEHPSHGSGQEQRPGSITTSCNMKAVNCNWSWSTNPDST